MRCAIFIMLCSLLSACQSTTDERVQANDPFYAPVVPNYPEETVIEDGSLFRPHLANSLYSDVTARQVGDIITVVLSENTAATKSANTTTSRETTADLQPITGLAGNAINIGNQSIQFGLDSSNDFSGDAAANQTNSLQGAISVTVVDVLPNKNLVVRGEKWMTLNHGDEYIRRRG